MPDDPTRIQTNLEIAIRRRSGQRERIQNLRRLTGGASAQTWSFDVVSEGVTRGRILRRRQGRESIGLDTATESNVQSVAADAGVPTAEVCFLLDDEDALDRGYVMQRIDGETIPRKILRDREYADAITKMARQCGQIASAIHLVDLTRLPPLRDDSPGEQLEALGARYRDFGQDLPVFEVALSWLANHLPPTVKSTLVHGDFRNGNFVVGPEGVRAVLDWELAHLGDPTEDLGWLCVNSWRYGQIDLPVGGFGSREDLIAGYESAGGGRVEPSALHYWEVFGTLRWGVICLIQTFAHLSGDHRSVERAAIGRGVSETELDLLNLFD